MHTVPQTWTGHNLLDRNDLHLAEDLEGRLGRVLIEEQVEDCIVIMQ